MNINQASLINNYSGPAFSRPQSPSAKNNESSSSISTANNALTNSNSSSSTATVTFSTTEKGSNDNAGTYSKPAVTNQNSSNNDAEINKANNAAEKTEKNESEEKPIKEENVDQKNKLQLSEEETKSVQELKKRDQEVRTHEAAHLAAAGKYATGGASFDYQRGPDGKNYAVGGEVGIDTSPIPNNPQATLQKAQQIRAAAQAPASPSSQDRQVAASATQMEAQARQEIVELTLEKPNATEAKNGDNTEANVENKNVEANNAEKNTKQIPESKNETASASASATTQDNTTYQRKAASAYQAVGNISQQASEAASLIEIFA